MAEPTTEVTEAPEAGEHAGLTDEQRAHRAEALARVRKFGDPALRSRASEVREFDDELAAEAERMIEIGAGAIGAARPATQLGSMRGLLVFQAASEARPTALVNPQI